MAEVPAVTMAPMTTLCYDDRLDTLQSHTADKWVDLIPGSQEAEQC